MRLLREYIKLELQEDTSAMNIVLDVAGLIPGVGEVADLANAVDYARKGDYLFSALSLISVIPTIGDLVGKGGKVALALSKLGKGGTKMAKAASAATKGKKFTQTSEYIVKMRKILSANEGLVDSVFEKAEEIDNEELQKHLPKIKEALQLFIRETEEVEAAANESILRECIRRLLTEAAKGPADLPEGVYVQINRRGRVALVLYVDKKGEEIQQSQQRGDLPPAPYGEIGIEKPSAEGAPGGWKMGPCGDAWMVGYSEAAHGWGPLLYDVAMEYATLNGGGMIADRTGVSGEAQEVWNYYLGKRGDVKSHQLDDRINTLTPDIEEDNCEQAVAGWHPETKYGTGTWADSPLSKRYTKPPTTIRQLDQLGRLIEL